MTRCVLVLTEQRVVALHEANGVRPYPGVLLQSPGEKIFLFLFLTRFLHSLSLSRTCLMSWHLFFQFLYQPLHTHTLIHSTTSSPCPHTLFLVSLFLPHPVFFLLAFIMLQKGLRNTIILCYHKTFSAIVLRILCANIHCPTF